jgi:hypothetical protein
VAIRDYVAKYVADLTGYKLTPAITDTEKLERETDQTADSVVRDWQRMSDAAKREGHEMSRAATTTGQDVRRKYGDAGREAGAEFSQNLGQAIESGDAGGVALGTLGGLAATVGASGPIGLGLVAVGGIATAVFGTMKKNAEAAATAVQTAFDQIIEGATKEAKLRTQLETIFGTYAEGLAAIGQIAGDTGVSVAEISDALAEGGQPARDLAAELDAIAAAQERAATAAGDYKKEVETGIAADRARGLADDLERAADATERAYAAEQLRADALRTSSRYFADAYGPGSSTYQSQVPTYRGGTRYGPRTTGRS